MTGLLIVKNPELDNPLPHGETGVTETVPLMLLTVNTIEFVFVPEVITLPDGTDQLYEEAPETGEIEYTFPTDPEQMVFVPEINPALPAPVVILIAKFWLELVLQEFIADTESVPPKLLEVIVMKFVTEVPDHPDGKFHLYEVAPETVGVEYPLTELGQTPVAPVIDTG